MIWDAQQLLLLQSGKPIRHHSYVRITVRQLNDNSPQTFGFWTGYDDQTETVEGTATTFIGAGGALKIPNVVIEPGTVIRQFSIGLDVAAGGDELIRQYDAQGAPISLYFRIKDLTTNQWAGGFARAYKGYVDKAPIPTPPPGELATMTLGCVTTARDGTKTSGSLMSNAAMRRRSATDGGLEYAGIVAANDPWGAADV